jgi:hypothetical protein
MRWCAASMQSDRGHFGSGANQIECDSAQTLFLTLSQLLKKEPASLVRPE